MLALALLLAIIFKLSEAAHCDYHKLGYILSRAKYETYIFIDSSKNDDKVTKFLNFTKEVYTSIAPDEKFIYDIKEEASK